MWFNVFWIRLSVQNHLKRLIRLKKLNLKNCMLAQASYLPLISSRSEHLNLAIKFYPNRLKMWPKVFELNFGYNITWKGSSRWKMLSLENCILAQASYLPLISSRSEHLKLAIKFVPNRLKMWLKVFWARLWVQNHLKRLITLKNVEFEKLHTSSSIIPTSYILPIWTSKIDHIIFSKSCGNVV